MPRWSSWALVWLAGMNVSECFLKGAVTTRQKFGSLRTLLCVDNIHANFIGNFEQIIEMLKERGKAVETAQPLSDKVSITPQECHLSDSWPLTKASTEKHRCAIVSVPPVAFYRIT